MYCAHFGLHRPPFNNTPDPTFYFSTPEHEEALATLQYATLQRKGFVLVSGEIGAGKTLTARLFLRQMDRNASVAVINHTSLNGKQLLAAICAEFDLHPPADANTLQLTERLQNFLLEQFARNRFVVVLVDEAQNLADESFEELRMLGNLEADDAKLLQVCILGQPELRERFRQPSLRQLDQRLFRRFHLPSLNRQLTENYILHRLKIAGCERKDLFTSAAIDLIHAASQGTPRLINQMCDNALLTAFGENARQIDEKIVDRVIDRDPHVVSPGQSMAAPCLQTPESHGHVPPTKEHLQEVEQRMQQQWKGVQDKFQSFREEVKSALKDVSGDYQAIQQQFEKLTQEVAPTVEIDCLRQDHAQQTQRLLQGIDQYRGEFQQLIERSQKCWEETRRQVTCLQSSVPSNEVIAKLESGFQTQVQQLSAQIDRQRQQLVDLTGDLGNHREGTTRQISQLRAANEQSTERLGYETDQKMLRTRQALEGKIAQCEEQIHDLDRQVTLRLATTREFLERIHEQAASAADVEAARAEHRTAMQQFLDRFQAQANELTLLKSQLHEQARGRNEQERAAMAKLARSVVTEARRVRQLRHALTQHVGVTDDRLKELSRHFASHADVEKVKQNCHDEVAHLRSEQESKLTKLHENQHQQSKALLDRVESDRRTLQKLISRIAERFRTTQKQLDTLSTSTADKNALHQVESRAQEEADRLLQLLEKCSHATERQFAEVAARLTQMDEGLTALHGSSANAADVEQLCARQEQERDSLLATLATQRHDWETVLGQVQSRCEQLDSQLQSLSAEVVTTTAFDAAREEHTKQIHDLHAGVDTLRSEHELQFMQLRETQHQESQELLSRLAGGRRTLQRLISRIVQRFRATQQQLDTLSATTVSKDAFTEMEGRTQQDVSQLLHLLDKCNGAMEQQFSEVAARLTQMDENFALLRKSSATASEVEQFRRQHEQERQSLLAALGSQRHDWETIFEQVHTRCELLDSQLRNLSADAVTTATLDTVRYEYAEQIRHVLIAIEERKQTLDGALTRVTAHCNQTQEAVRKLAQHAASASALDRLRRQHTSQLSEMTKRLDVATNRHLEDVNLLARELLTQEKRVTEIEVREQPKPVHVELTPQVAGKLGELVAAAQAETDKLAQGMDHVDAIAARVDETSGRIEGALQHWQANADQIAQQSEQLRASATVSERILKAMQACHKVLDRKLNSTRWQTELARGEELASRLDQAARQAALATERLTAALRNFESVQDAEEEWSQRQKEAQSMTAHVQRMTTQLAKLLVEAKQTSGTFGRSLEKRKQMLQVVARSTGRLMDMLDGARQADEEPKPAESPRLTDPTDKPRRTTRLTPSNWSPLTPKPATITRTG